MGLQKHIAFMKIAMELAEKGRGLVSPNPMVGALLVRKGRVIAQDWHRKFGEGHAERNLLGNVKRNTNNLQIEEGDVLYVTLEPCCHTNKKTKPCTDLILEKGVKKIVVGLFDPNPEVSGKGVRMLRKKGIEVVVLEEESSRQFKGDIKNSPNLQGVLEELKWKNRFFFKWIRDRKPWVTLKIAQTLDGRIVHKRGETLLLTGDESRQHVHQKRAEYDALLVGVKTILADDSRLTVRDKADMPLASQPFVIVLDAALSTPITAAVVRPGTILFRGRQFQRRTSRKAQFIEKGVEVLEVDTNESGYLHLGQILDELAARGISSLYVEGGPSVWSSFLKQGYVDELMVYFAPKFLGDGVETFEMAEGSGQRAVKEIRFREMKVLGEDVYWQGSFLAS